MSEARLRELERRWRESSSVEDGAAYLAALVRAGHVTRERLLVASYVGHAPARRVITQSEDPVLRAARDDGYFQRVLDEARANPNAAILVSAEGERYRWALRRWLQRLGRWGAEPVRHAALGIVRRLARDGSTSALTDGAALLEGLIAQRAGSVEAADRFARALAPEAPGPFEPRPPSTPDSLAGLLVAAGLPPREDAPRLLRGAVALEDAGGELVAAGHLGEPSLRRAVRKAVSAWALPQV